MHKFLLLAADGAAVEDTAQALDELINMEPHQLWERMKAAFSSFWPTLLSAVLIFVAGYLLIFSLNKLLKRLLRHSKVDETLHYFIQNTVRFILSCILLLTCLGVLGVPLTPLITLLGTAGLALSLALQDSLSNVAGGISVLLNRPFAKDDFIEVGGISGTVRQIRLVYTVLSTTDNKDIYIPNGDISKGVVINYSAEPVRRLDLVFPVRADSDVERALAIIQEVVAAARWVEKEPAPVIRVSDHTFALIQISCFTWVRSADMPELKSHLIQAVRARLNGEGFCSVYSPRD